MSLEELEQGYDYTNEAQEEIEEKVEEELIDMLDEMSEEKVRERIEELDDEEFQDLALTVLGYITETS